MADVHALREELAGRLPALPPVAEETWAYSLTLAAPDGYRIKFFSRRVPAGSGNAAAR